MENLQVIKDKENHLFNRKEILVEVIAKITPKEEEVENILSEKFSVPKENVKVKKIQGSFGSNNFKISANIYKSQEDKNKTEPKAKKDKSKTEAPAN